MVSGFLISLAVIKFGAEKFRSELINTEDERRPIGRWYVFVMTYVVPVEFLALIAWWFYQSIKVYDPDGWWHPFHSYSVGTTVLQWGALILALILANRWWANRVGANTGEAR
jgi:NSS family neurotransmitter:Na+ symporter